MIRLLFAATLCFALAACGDDDDTNGDGDGAGGLSAAGGETSAAGGETSVVGGEMSAPGGEMSGGGGETRAGGEMGAGGMAGTGGMAGAGGTGVSGDFPELWLHFALSYRNEADCASKRALLDRAVAAGYTGLFVHSFWDALVLTDEIDPHDASYCFDEMMQRISDSGLEVMLSYGTGLGVGEPMLRENPNWAEGFPVRGTPYTVSAAGDRLEPTSENLIPNGGIEEHTGDQVNGWSWNDPTTGVDTEVFHSGGASFRVRLDGENAARGGIAMTLTPYRQYEVRFWAKTRDVAFLPGDDFWSSFWGVRVRGSGEGGAGWLHYNQFVAESTQDWTEFSFVFHSLGFEAATVYVGAMPWEGQGNTGTIWIDDLSIRETGLVNLIRRDDAPLVARKVGGEVLVEGVDFDPIVDPLMGVAAGYPGTYDYGHAAPVITLPADSRLQAGDRVTLDYAVAVMGQGSSISVSMCSDEVLAAQGARFDRIRAHYPMATRYFLEYDEIRQGNWGPDCEALGLDAGPLMARHVANTAAQLQDRVPGARTYTWNDMFDPHHNAVADYYMMRGDLAGSWEGLPEDTIIVNWHHTAESLQFLSDRGHRQLLGNITGANAQATMDRAADIPGVMGLFFVNWGRNAADWDIETAAQVFHDRFGQ